MALILEVVGGAVGLPGLGWLYSGQTGRGLVLLGVMLALDAVGLVVALSTVLISCVCSIPLTWVVMGVSAYLLNNHARQHPETFGP